MRTIHTPDDPYDAPCPGQTSVKPASLPSFFSFPLFFVFPFLFPFLFPFPPPFCRFSVCPPVCLSRTRLRVHDGLVRSVFRHVVDVELRLQCWPLDRPFGRYCLLACRMATPSAKHALTTLP